ncbi:MAG TPA: lysine--tRNA ligase [Spirochaetota bacterium]|nr:lysine--tRNA ligase [Spirochaetota bacterium]
MKEAFHWADQTVARIIKQKGDKDCYVCASGISPSGSIHIGNFREIITTELIVRAFKKRGKKVRFIYSWDDYDRLRKVPAGISGSYENYIGRPYCDIPSPYDKDLSYAAYFENEFEQSLHQVGIDAEYIRQGYMYKKCTYKELIKKVLRNTGSVKKILNKFRKTPLADNWYPVTVYCSSCGTDNTTLTSYNNEYLLKYTCSCGHNGETDFAKQGNVKLVWRVDWPMRWCYEQVDFEPGGKDHSSQGGSYDTARIISKEIFDYEPPVYIMYDFVRIKGKGGKISSSAGDVIRLKDVLDIYEPAMVRWLFASYRTNVEFAVSFDLDVLKYYEDFDRLERRYFGQEPLSAKKKKQQERVYQLAQPGSVYKDKPFRASFRHLCNIIQINSFDKSKTAAYYRKEIKNSYDEELLLQRIERAVNWLEQYAPADFRFTVNETPVRIELPPGYIGAFQEIRACLAGGGDIDELKLSQKFYELINKYQLDNKNFFYFFYKLLINKDKGPKLAGFILTIGAEKAANLLRNI